MKKTLMFLLISMACFAGSNKITVASAGVSQRLFLADADYEINGLGRTTAM